MKGSSSKIAAIIGGVMVVTVILSMLLTTFLPGGLSRPAATPVQQNFAEPTLGPVAFPTPDPDGPGLTLAQLAVHPAGTFVIAQPAGFTSASTASAAIHSLSLVDTTRYAVVHAYLQQHTGPQDLSSLDAYNSAAALAGTWSEYDGWAETGREQAADRLVIDFTLDLGENTYLARQITWVVAELPTYAYVLRFVVPDNYPALLGELELLIIPSYRAIPEALTVPLGWPGAVSMAGGYALRYPPEWTLIGDTTGSIVTLTTPEGGTLTLSSAAGQVASEEEARAWAEASRADARVLAVAPLARTLGDGYAVSYAFSTTDGDPASGLSLLLNGPDGQLKSATLRLDMADADLLAADGRATYAAVWQALDTFSPLPAGATLPAATR